jgi:5-methylcytosine-specific restriction endonuclease McrA
MMGTWKMRIIGRAIRDWGSFMVPISLGKGPKEQIALRANAADFNGREIEDKQNNVPVHVQDRIWVFHNDVVQVDSPDDLNLDELALRITHLVLKGDKTISKIKREVEYLQNLKSRPATRRKPIPDDVRMFIWQRDEGRCIKCGNREQLEYDHIIPVAEGGSNTARNIQLLCETCNRQKGKSI